MQKTKTKDVFREKNWTSRVATGGRKVTISWHAFIRAALLLFGQRDIYMTVTHPLALFAFFKLERPQTRGFMRVMIERARPHLDAEQEYPTPWSNCQDGGG